jgi:hypothetical protein
MSLIDMRSHQCIALDTLVFGPTSLARFDRFGRTSFGRDSFRRATNLGSLSNYLPANWGVIASSLLPLDQSCLSLFRRIILVNFIGNQLDRKARLVSRFPPHGYFSSGD